MPPSRLTCRWCKSTLTIVRCDLCRESLCLNHAYRFSARAPGQGPRFRHICEYDCVPYGRNPRKYELRLPTVDYRTTLRELYRLLGIGQTHAATKLIRRTLRLRVRTPAPDPRRARSSGTA